jgi:hypothetical protein
MPVFALQPVALGNVSSVDSTVSMFSCSAAARVGVLVHARLVLLPLLLEQEKF